VINTTPRPLYRRQWHGLVVSGPVWMGTENLASTGFRSPDRPARINWNLKLTSHHSEAKNAWNCTSSTPPRLHAVVLIEQVTKTSAFVDFWGAFSSIQCYNRCPSVCTYERTRQSLIRVDIWDFHAHLWARFKSSYSSIHTITNTSLRLRSASTGLCARLRSVSVAKCV
jgi:hypothetical protein